MVYFKKVFIVFFLSCFLFTAPALSAQLETEDVVRVAIKKQIPSAILTVKGPYKILALYTNQELASGKKIRNAKIVPTYSGVKIGNKEFKVFGVKIWTKKNPGIYIGRRKFKGMLDIIRTKENKLLLVNELPVEEYLKGVLYHEVSHRWPIEVIKAQAIAARTFALYQAECNKNKDYDVTTDVFSQVYGGATSEKYKTNKAVKATKGLILTYQDELLPAYYHATCAGHTEDAGQLWNEDLLPLKGIKCDFCKRSRHYSWKKKIKLNNLEEKLRNSGYHLGRIISIEIERKNPSGRITNLIINGTAQSSIIKAKDFRLMLGSNFIRSTNFDVEINDGWVIFKGVGWGHGVGMCQWGAYYMARKKSKAEDILKYYYPGAEITSVNE